MTVYLLIYALVKTKGDAKSLINCSSHYVDNCLSMNLKLFKLSRQTVRVCLSFGLAVLTFYMDVGDPN